MAPGERGYWPQQIRRAGHPRNHTPPFHRNRTGGKVLSCQRANRTQGSQGRGCTKDVYRQTAKHVLSVEPRIQTDMSENSRFSDELKKSAKREAVLL